MKLIKYLANLGYGTRREVTYLVDAKRVTTASGIILREGNRFTHNEVLIDDEPLDPPPGAALMFHKPVDYVCSTKETSRLIYELLPPRFRDRTPVMAPIGRLDRDTSGLLLLTDDGQLNHRVTSPRAHLSKVYDATLANDLAGNEVALFASGALMLEGETTPLKPAELEVLNARSIRLTITEGRYHQVRRMFAAVGNHVTSLHRVAIGALQLGSLAEGQWRVLASDEIPLLTPTPSQPPVP